MRLIEAQIEAHTAAAQGAIRPRPDDEMEVDGDEFGENSLPPAHRQQLASFPGQQKKDIIAIAKNTFNPRNLPNLDKCHNFDHDDTENIISMDGDKLKTKKTVGKLSAFGATPKIWSRTFLIFVGIFMAFHGAQHPQLAYKMISFHNRIIELAGTYKWQDAVLNLAIRFLEERFSNGITEASLWVLPVTLIDEFTRAHMLPTGGDGGGKKDRERKKTSLNPSTNAPGVKCNNFNSEKGCTHSYCKRDHKCENCDGDHPVHKCFSKQKK
jgi:hypothetical protein